MSAALRIREPLPEALPAVARIAGEPVDDELTARQWCNLLCVSPQAFRRRCTETREALIAGRPTQLFAFAHLPADYRVRLDALKTRHAAPSFAALAEMQAAEMRGWRSPKSWLEYKPSVRARAEARFAMMRVFYEAREDGAAIGEAVALAQREFEQINGTAISSRQVARWRKIADARGGAFAPKTAFCDEKEAAHVSRRLHVPEEFLAALRAKSVAPGVGTWSAAVRAFQIAWAGGDEVPGLGRAQQAAEPFPYTAKQLQQFCPSKAARVQGARGKFAAKCAGLLPAPPISSRNMRLRERILFDDKRLDIIALDDRTRRPVSLTLYLAMDEATRQILGYLLREAGAVRQIDVEGLTAFVLRVCGFAGIGAGYPTRLKFERGSVAISREREALLTGLFPGQLIIERTGMIGGTNAPGDYAQEASGNWFGKGKLESFMATLDHYTRHIAGQRGNLYVNQPLTLGDLLLTPEKLSHPSYQRKGTMIEEAVFTAHAAAGLHWLETGKIADGAETSRETGVRGPLLFVSEVNLAVQAAIAFYNAERGHRRDGFDRVRVMMPDGSQRVMTESANDRAAHLEEVLAQAGRSLTRISAQDAAVLLHKCRKVVVRPNGARVRIGGVERLYWSERSLAVAAAQASSRGEKEYLALFNPEDPRELLLLQNAVGHFPPRADELPPGVEPRFFEKLPIYDAPDANDEAQLLERARRVAATHNVINFELAKASAPRIAEETRRRERNLALSEPLRAAVAVLAEFSDRKKLPPSPVAQELSERPQRAEEERACKAADDEDEF